MPRVVPPVPCQYCQRPTPASALCDGHICPACHTEFPLLCGGARCDRCLTAHTPLVVVNSQDLCHTCAGVLLPSWRDHWPALPLDTPPSRQAVCHTGDAEGRFWYADSLKNRQVWSSSRLAAVEVECCGVGLHPRVAPSPVNKVADRWGCDIGHDGSLPTEGFELRTSPAAGDFLYSQLTQLGDAFEAQAGVVNERAGMHCHVDCRDFDWLTAARYIKLYARLERALFFIASPGRAFNHYSQPCGPAFDRRINRSLAKRVAVTKRALYTDLYGTGISASALTRLRASQSHNLRYRALNVHSWLFRGTMEVRIHPGELRGWAMFGWAALMATLADLAYTMRDSDLDSLFPDVPNFATVPSWSTLRIFSSEGIHYTCERLKQLVAVLPPILRNYIALRWNELYQAHSLPTLSGPRIRRLAHYTLQADNSGHRINSSVHGEIPDVLSPDIRGVLSQQLAWLEPVTESRRLITRRAA